MSKTALVVDADFFFVEFVSELLTKRGYTVTKAYDGKDGISKLKDLPYDIVFVDLVMPKVDGSQFIDFARQKYGPNHFPIVALSGVIVEQLGSLDEIGADYYIAKGPIDKLTVQLNGLMVEIETQSPSPSDHIKIMKIGGVYPRRDAVGLLDALKFHQAVIESLAVGVIVVDVDVRIVKANPVAFEIIGKSPAEVINHSVLDVFPPQITPQMASILKQVAQLPEKTKMSFLSDFNNRAIRTSISVISQSAGNAGWVLVLADAIVN